MAYFPMFVDLEGKKVLIVGGGGVALRKAEKLLPFGCEITVVAERIRPEFSGLGVSCICRSFSEDDLRDAFMVIAATDDTGVNSLVCSLAGRRGIPADCAEGTGSTFLFPALVKRGRLTVGITTSGTSPTASAWVKGQVAESLPENMEEILDYLDTLRLRSAPGQTRREKMAAAFALCRELGRPLTKEEEASL